MRHRYETRATVDGQGHRPVVDEMIGAARRDMRGEGFAEPRQIDLH